jgi:hypothetical protein
MCMLTTLHLAGAFDIAGREREREVSQMTSSAHVEKEQLARALAAAQQNRAALLEEVKHLEVELELERVAQEFLLAKRATLLHNLEEERYQTRQQQVLFYSPDMCLNVCVFITKRLMCLRGPYCRRTEPSSRVN